MEILNIRRGFICVALLVTHALLLPFMAVAFEPAENDDFYLSLGSSNIEVRDSDDLLSGSNVSAGLRIGLFSTFFLEFGWGNIAYSDQVNVAGVTEAIDFTTIGPHIGLGFLIPVRSFQIGGRIQAVSEKTTCPRRKSAPWWWRPSRPGGSTSPPISRAWNSGSAAPNGSGSLFRNRRDDPRPRLSFPVGTAIGVVIPRQEIYHGRVGYRPSYPELREQRR